MTVDLEAVERAAASVSARFAQPVPVGSDEMVHDEAARLVEFAVPAMVAEIRCLRAMTSCTMGVGRGDGRLFVHGDYESVRAAQAFVFAVERVRALPAKWLTEYAESGRDREDIGHAQCADELEAALAGKGAQ
jgi:hypothetical protein